MKNKWIIWFLSFLIPVIGGFCFYNYLSKHNKHVKQWHELPFEAKAMAGMHAVECLSNRLMPPKIDTSVYAEINADTIRKSIELGAKWLVGMQEENGRFKYWYNPELKEYSSPNDDNFLRQAATGYSLMLTYEVIKDSSFLQSAILNLEYLLQFKEKLNDSTSYFLYNNKAKLGAIALPMLTICKLNSVCKDTTCNNLAEELANMIIFLQESQKNGKFKSTYIFHSDYEFEKHSGWESDIYPGEALLALALMYKNTGKEKYKTSFEKAIEYYSIKRRWKSNGFVTWAISACSEMYLITKEESYAHFAFKMCDYGLKWQNLNSGYFTYGSLDPLPNVFTATMFEGIGDAIIAAEVLGENEKFDFYKQRSMIAYNWIMKMQYIDKSFDEKAYGGFRNNSYNSEIRIDNTQHAISALIRSLKFIEI